MQRGSSPRPIIEYVTTSDDGVNWIKIGDMPHFGRIVTSTEEKITKEGAKKSRQVNKGDLILSNSMSYGLPYIMGIDGYIHDGWFVLKNFENTFDKDYLCNLLISSAIQNQYKRLAAGGVVQNISSDLVNSVSVSIPTMMEQKKISSLLNLIDERIATQNKIIEDLKKLKSAICEKLFCTPKDKQPKVRLHGFSDAWHFVRLSDICHRIRCKNTGEQCKQVLTIAAQYGLVSQEDFFNKNVASENLSGYYLLQKGDFAYNKSYSGDYAWGTVKRLDNYKQGVLSPLYICFRLDSARVDSDFLVYYFESKKWYKAVADIAGEGARNHGLLNISVIDYFNTIHCIPSIEEQKQIAWIMRTLSSKITQEQRMLNCCIAQRKYLLRQMFI
ncbi:restriction endonuclease subunit S [uncultured Phocaeicola sp.]|uniref:restriction endonuclease subunit S n=2 Tax=Bacteroidaceae TaxID=815 RepID=UPI0025ADEDC4|nr:restriction endonuclease subunit S [uncultured Phocaeicola sp.]